MKCQKCNKESPILVKLSIIKINDYGDDKKEKVLEKDLCREHATEEVRHFEADGLADDATEMQ